MIKLMIIEDEFLQRELLKNVIDWSLYDTEIVCEASDSDEALQLATQYQPDVIFLDIVIHGENGIETAKKIRERVEFCQIIIITAYGTFDFAREAIYAGVCGYLLKPIDPAELLPLFLNASEKALYDKARAEHEKELRFQKQIFEVLSGVSDLSDAQKRDLNLDRKGFLNMIYISFASELSEEYADLIDQISDQAVLSYPDGIVLHASYALLLFLIESSSDLVTFDIETSIFAEDIQALLAEKHISCSLVRSSSYTSVQDFRTAFQDASDKLKDLEKTDKLYNSPDHIHSIYKNVTALQEVLAQPVSQKSIQKCQPLLESLITETIHLPLHWSEKYHLLNHVFSLLLEHGARNNCMLPSKDISRLHQLLGVIKRKNETARVEKGLVSIVEDYLASLENVRHSPSQRKVHSAQAYISVHYKDPNLTLREVADAVEASPCYLSNIFKTESGVSFSSYLTSFRLQKANDAIKEDKKKPLYQIAEESGYSDYYYFCRRFRQFFGVSPSEVQ